MLGSPNRYARKASGILLLACAAALGARAQLSSPAASVGLTARMPETASVQWHVQPATAAVQENGLRADLLVLASTWHFAVGQTVRAECELQGATPEEAALLPLKDAGEAPDPPIYSFLPRSVPTTVSLLSEFAPQLGPQTRTNGLLLISADPPAVQTPILRITVIAF